VTEYILIGTLNFRFVTFISSIKVPTN
jgi:hypothetical protein